MLKVGLTGGIACGKSRAARRLAARGLHVLDLDGVAHELMAPGGAAYEDVVRAFGEGILSVDKAIDRRALAARVFGDREALARLNAIVHPRVREEESRRAAALAGSGEVLVTDAAILVESGLHLRFDRLVVVDCRPEQQVARLAARDGMPEEGARARIAAQMPLEEKRRFAHFVIDGSLAFAETDRMADAVADALRELASRPAAAVIVPVARGVAAFARGPRQGPRGLTPVAVLAEIAEAGGIEMQRLAARLDPPAGGPWHRAAAAPAPEGPRPEALALPVALASVARRGLDPDYTAAAAASVARLTHRDPSAIADACLAALALAHVAASGAIAAPPTRWAEWSRLAERWGGAPTSGGVERAFARAGEAAADDTVLDGSLAGAFAGLATGRAVTMPPESVAADLTVLARKVDGTTD